MKSWVSFGGKERFKSPQAQSRGSNPGPYGRKAEGIISQGHLSIYVSLFQSNIEMFLVYKIECS